MGGGNAGVGSSTGVDGVDVCLVNIGVDVGCVVMGALFVLELLGCVSKVGCPGVEG